MRYYIFKDSTIKLNIGKIICLVRTYREHAHEMRSNIPKEPVFFLKPSTAIIFSNSSILFPERSKCLHHEIELGVVIGKECKNVSRGNALDYVIGYCVCLDITARDLQDIAKKEGLPWGIAKCFDTFAPISEVVPKEEVKDPNNLDICLKVNNEIRQKANTKDMIFSVEEIIEYLSNIMTLEPGDLIMTGTPRGVGEIRRGDILEASLDDLCYLKVDVR